MRLQIFFDEQADMGKEAKTNAMRMLDRQKIPYEAVTYECTEFSDGVHAAEIAGTPADRTFKTLVTVGKSGQHYVCVIPIAAEIDLKRAAAEAGEKTLEMIHVRELTPLTGYVRGGCSPIGMKKPFPVLLDASAGEGEKIYISGGRLGLTLCLKSADLIRVTGGRVGSIVRK